MPTSLASSITPRSQLAEKPRLGAFAHRGFQNRLFKPKSTNGCYLAGQANQISARDDKPDALARTRRHFVERLPRRVGGIPFRARRSPHGELRLVAAMIVEACRAGNEHLRHVGESQVDGISAGR